MGLLCPMDQFRIYEEKKQLQLVLSFEFHPTPASTKNMLARTLRISNSKMNMKRTLETKSHDKKSSTMTLGNTESQFNVKVSKTEQLHTNERYSYLLGRRQLMG